MYLNCAKIKSKPRKMPALRLRTMSGKELGTIPYVYGLHFEINYTELSKITFTVPYQVNGMLNPLYHAVSSFAEVYTDDFGVYILAAPSKDGDGMSETKTVTGYSREYLFEKKMLFLEEGTYNFWNPVDPSDTILGRIVELDSTWRVGYVDPRLIGCYRTFEQYDSDALSFCYSDAMEKYNCAIVFDVYERTINAYDAAKNAEALPIYLSYQNLVDNIGVEEIIDEMATKLHLYGSDGLTIRDVNPTGADYIVDLSYFLLKGDLDIKVGESEALLSSRVKAWQTEIEEIQAYYTGLVSSRASLTARKLSSEAELSELNGEMDVLVAQQSVVIQAFALETTDEGKQKRQAELDAVNLKIAAKQVEIDACQGTVDGLQSDIDSYMDRIRQITSRLSMDSYFTDEERCILNQYMIEATVEEETFVATDVDTEASGAVQKITGTVLVSDADITMVELKEFQRTMYIVTGGTVSIPSSGISAEIVRGTLDAKADGGYVLTASLGSTAYSGHTFDSGLLTVNGTLSQFSNNISAEAEYGVTEYKGSEFRFSTTDADAYFTVSMTEFQQYSVAMELYDFGMDVLGDYAWPVYEFNIDSANFLYQEKFEPFKNKLELGRSVYLELGSEGVVKPKVIGVELDFDDISSFKLVFSNRYQLKNGENFWRDIIRSTTRSSRSFDAGKYIYNRAADKATQVDEFMNGLQKGTIEAILKANNQSVVFDGAGLHIGGDSNYQMRVTDRMLAMTDDGWKTAKVGIGLFAHAGINNGNPIWGVNTELLAGNLIIGNGVVIQNPLIDENGHVTGTMMFQVDSTGAWLYNSRFVLQDADNGGLIIIDPRYGIVAGTNLLFDTNGTTVTPEFMDSAGNITFDSEGMPQNANFFLNIDDGSAYFRGKLIAKSGKIGGYTIENGYLHSGSDKTYVALNGGTDVYADFAIWAGESDPNNAPFWVKKNGDIKVKNGTFSGKLEGATGSFTGAVTATSGTFKGTVQASQFLDPSGKDMMNASGQFKNDYLEVKRLNVNNKFIVDEAGNVSMQGNINLSGGSITWDSTNTPVQYQFSINGQTNWHTTMTSVDKYRRDSLDGGRTWGSPYQFRGEDGQPGRDGVDGSDASVTFDNIRRALQRAYSTESSFITVDSMGAPVIYGGEIYGSTFYGNQFNVISQGSSGGFSLYGRYNGRDYEVFNVSYSAGDAPKAFISGLNLTVSSSISFLAYTTFNNTTVNFTSSTVDFSNANVIGLSSTATFG